MKWVSSMSESEETPDAVAEAVAGIKRGLEGDKPTALFVFTSAEHAAAFNELPQEILRELPADALVGCSGGGIIGGGHEVENRPALSILAAVMPDVKVKATRIEAEDLPETDTALRWHELLGVAPEDDPHFVVLADPMSVAGKTWLPALDRAFPNATKIGGLVSGSHSAEGLRLFTNDTVANSGVTVLSCAGDVRLSPIIAQGCKPVGDPMIITSCEGNRIYSLDQKKPADLLRSIFNSLGEEDKALFRTSLFVGLQMKDQIEYTQGDFLIRNLLGVLPDGESLAIGAEVDRWQVLQFHLRDRAAAAADLGHQLGRYLESAPSASPAGALLFSCLGRGEYLFERPNHDSDLFRERVGDIPLGGFFCNGEIGPVSGSTYAHGYTSAFGVFTRK